MTESEKFVLMLEKTYGKYQGSMMRDIIANRLSKASKEHLSRLYDEITSYFMPAYSQPPTLAHILKYQRGLSPIGRMQIEDQTEGYVSREEGLLFIKELMQKLEKGEV